MKKMVRIKLIRIKKIDFESIRKEWSKENIRNLFCYCPQLWLGLPVVAAVSFAALYVLSATSGFGVNPLHQGLIAMASSTVTYAVGMMSLASNAKQAVESDEEEQSARQQMLTGVILVLCCLLVVAGVVSKIIQDRAEIIGAVITVVAIVAAVAPSILMRLIRR